MRCTPIRGREKVKERQSPGPSLPAPVRGPFQASIAALLLAAAATIVLWSGSAAAARPRYGGEAKLGAADPVSVIDPLRARLPSERLISSLIYETLFVRAPVRPRPVLAESISANADSTRWTLVLRKGLELHDGRPLTADDVVYSLKRAAREARSSCRWTLGDMKSAGRPVISDPASGREIVISFRAPEPDLPLILSNPALAIVPRPAPGGGAVKNAPATAGPGTGPFRFEQGGSSSRVVLRAYENHREGRPFLDALRWRLIREDDAPVEIQGGSLDLYIGPASPMWDVARPPPGRGSIAVVRSCYMLYLACNPERSGLASPANRMRLFDSIDRGSILRSIIGKWGRPALELLPGARTSPAQKGHEAGRAESRGAALKAGGRELTLISPRWNGAAGEVADRIQVDLLSAGYEVTARKLGREEMSYKLGSGDFDVYVGVWSPDRWIEDGAWLAADLRQTQIEPVPVVASAAKRGLAGSLEDISDADRSIYETLRRDAVLFPLYEIDGAILRGPALSPIGGAPDGVPDMAWSWIAPRR